MTDISNTTTEKEASQPSVITEGQLAVPEKTQPYIAFLDDGRLFISKSHLFNAHVQSFVARLDRLGESYEKHPVEMSVIADFYTHKERQESGSRSSSSMQREGLDLFKRAVERSASDIHIRVTSEKTQILFRVNNDLEFIAEDTADFGGQLCSTIYQSMTQISDATFQVNARQDARISDENKMPPELQGLRVATTPQVDGHIMVLRLLYNDNSEDFSLINLGYTETQNNIITLLQRLPTGINIIAGPTGSGKSTTLQRVLGITNKYNEGRKHIITIEDPPEYPIPGAVQTPVANADTNEARSEAFQAAIKASMRLDPDIIMIGEIRDGPSAKLGIEAAMTGHQVWATLHANTSLAILDRLIDLGVPADLVYDHNIISGLISQRLVKTLCSHCKVPIGKVLSRYKQADLNRIFSVASSDNIYVTGEGCEHCNHSGVSGRASIAETIKTDSQLMQFFRAGKKVEAETYWHQEKSGKSVLDSAIEKVEKGLIDPFDAEHVVGPLIMGVIERDHRIDNMEIERAIK